MVMEVRATSQKEVSEEVGLEETNGKANAKARRWTGVLFSSNDDSHYEGQFDAKNHLGKVEESKVPLQMYQQLSW